MVLKEKVFKYGDRRTSVPIPKELSDEIVPGDPVEIHIDRSKKLIVYVFPESDISDEKVMVEVPKSMLDIIEKE